MRCSYGPGQVAGWWAPKFGGTWADLTNTRWNAWASFRVYKIKEDAATTAKNIRLRTLWDLLQAGTFDDKERARERRGNEE